MNRAARLTWQKLALPALALTLATSACPLPERPRTPPPEIPPQPIPMVEAAADAGPAQTVQGR